MSAIYIGIDPGLTGALAVIDDLGTPHVYDTPTIMLNSGRRDYVPRSMAEALEPQAPHGHASQTVVTLERVGARPGQGVASMFSFGRGVGIWQGIIAAHGHSLEQPTPQTWRRRLDLPAKADKAQSIVRALEIFPSMTDRLQRKKDHGRAEALLLAEYGRRVRAG